MVGAVEVQYDIFIADFSVASTIRVHVLDVHLERAWRLPSGRELQRYRFVCGDHKDVAVSSTCQSLTADLLPVVTGPACLISIHEDVVHHSCGLASVVGEGEGRGGGGGENQSEGIRKDYGESLG